jgi:hypothetical protein
MKLLPIIEKASKGPVFDCRMCGQCVLHSTGMTCPMTCPKTLRNGPCGGVRENGHCEVIPEMRCVWTVAEGRSHHPLNPNSWEHHFAELRPPVDNQLRGSSSWKNLLTKRDVQFPDGWVGITHEAAISELPFSSMGEVDDITALDQGFHDRTPLS